MRGEWLRRGCRGRARGRGRGRRGFTTINTQKWNEEKGGGGEEREQKHNTHTLFE